MTADAGENALLSTKKTTIISTSTFLVFEPGLYAILFKTERSGSTNVGLRLPCARLEAVGADGDGGIAAVTTLPEGGWISTETAAAYVLVAGGRAGALLTIYRSSDTATMPSVEFRAVFKSADIQPAAPVTGAENPAQAQLPGKGDPILSVTVHVQTLGDVAGRSGTWVGKQGGLQPIEGFQLDAPNLESGMITYQGVMGHDWLTPWSEVGHFCGSRGLNLPMLGYSIKLSAIASQLLEIEYSGIFNNAITIGPLKEGVCSADGKSLTAMKISLRARVVEIQPKPEARPSRRVRLPNEKTGQLK